MADIFNTNKLYWVFTNYANTKLNEFDTESNLKLTHIKIGNYDWYTDEDKILGEDGYSETAFKNYFQKEDPSDALELGNFIRSEVEDADGELPKLKFSITGKEKSTDNSCVILTITIDETYGGFDIRELGIYAEDGGKEKLFAVCTMQPLPKPKADVTNHYIATQIKCYLYSQRLVNYFDNIELDSNANYATINDLNNYQTNLLFVESNLSEQISRNTQIIGYNRIQQLQDLISDNQDKFSRFSISSVYADIANVLDVKNFWMFRPTGYLTRDAMLDDLSLYNENLSTDQLSTLYEHSYEGIASWLNFNNTHYYMLQPTSDVYQVTEEIDEETSVTNYYVANNHTDLTFIDLNVDENGKVLGETDSPFTLIFVGSQNSNVNECTLLAKYNTFTEHPGIYISVTPNRAINISMYTNKYNFINFKTPENSVPKAGEFYALILDYNGDSRNPNVTVNINGINIATEYTKSNYTYTGMSLDGIMLPMFSFERTADGDIKNINSKICLLSLLKGNFNTSYKQSLMYSLIALIGDNPCLM